MKESLLTDLFWHAGFFLAISALVIPLLRYLKIPVVLGYLFAGIALGPYALGLLVHQYPFLDTILLKDTEHVKILAELGIVLLLFVIGLEITPRRLWQMRSFVFGLGGAQVIVTSSVIGSIAYLWGNNVEVAVLLGLSLSLSSTAIVIQWLHEQKLFVTHTGRSSFSILLFQDLAVIPILLLLTILSADIQSNIFGYVSLSLLKMAATVIAIYVVGRIVLRPLFVFANKHGGSEVFVALSLLIIIVSASVASLAGLSMALGAFIAGLLLADTEYRHEISALIVPFKSMLLGIFFLSFGMGIDLSFIVEKPLWLFLSIFGLMIIKGAIIFSLCKLWKQSTAVSVESAILLSQAGEFGLLIVGSALSAGMIAQDVGQFMLITTGITMLLAPLMAVAARHTATYLEKLEHQNHAYDAQNSDDLEGHIVLFGYGRVGEEIGNTLSKEGYKILAFDKDLERVNLARAKTSNVYLGDVQTKAVIKSANIDNALCAVCTVDNAKVTKATVNSIRAQNSSIPIIVRARDSNDYSNYNELENVLALAEDKIIGQELSLLVISKCRTVLSIRRAG